MLEPLTERQKNLIVNNVVEACADINALNRTGYRFLYLCSGFIAHYNLYGFQDHYIYHSLREEILANRRANQWNNFRPGEQNYDYYMSRRDVYDRIVARIA